MELQRVLAHDTRKAMEKVYELYGEEAMVCLLYTSDAADE